MIKRVFKKPRNIQAASLEKFRQLTSDWGIPSTRADRWYYQLHYADGQVTTVNNARDAKASFEKRHTDRIFIHLRSTGGSFVEIDTRNPTRATCSVTWSHGDDGIFLDKIINAFDLQPLPPAVFISHGRRSDWEHVQRFIENEVGISLRAIELAAQTGGSVFIGDKFERYADQCSCAVVLMTGEDRAFDPDDTEQIRVRENVMHEIGYFQACLGADRVILLKEKGVNIPTNILGRQYIEYSPGHIAESDTPLRRELLDIFH